MKLLRQNGVLMLQIPPDIYFSFKQSWIKELRALPMEKYSEYIKTEIYPVFSGDEQSLFRKNSFSNKDLLDAIIAYLAEELS